MERCWLVHFVCSRSPTEEYCWKPQKGPLIDDSQQFKARKLLNCTNSNSCLARCHTVFPLRPDLHPKLSKLASTLSFLPTQTRSIHVFLPLCSSFECAFLPSPHQPLFFRGFVHVLPPRMCFWMPLQVMFASAWVKLRSMHIQPMVPQMAGPCLVPCV